MSANKRPPARGWRSRKVQLLVAGLVITGGVSGAVAWALTDSPHKSAATPAPTPTPTGTPGDQYVAAVLRDFSSMSTVLISYLQTLRQWQTDKVDDTQMKAVCIGLLDDVAAAQQALAARQPFLPAPRAIYDYRASADLYGQAAQLTQNATAVPRGALRTQLQLAISRIQTLADRVFDQGAAELKPFVTPDHDYDSVQITRADELPSFPASKLAAGPPLTDVGAAPTPHPYQTTRPEQSAADWVKVATAAHIPTDKDTEAAIDAGTVATLRTDTIAFAGASEKLHSTPDPTGERTVNTRIQLALLIDAEATQMGQAATLVPAAQHDNFLHVAQALSLIADRMWDERLGQRDSSYPTSLLTIQSQQPSEAPSAK
ncbi:MAG TPA: hypothetical protein VHX38_11475 [Pseudonocardiaceae bacterium]|jgi:hypothetical protein|nr:hypothetical protein [Pseudonocardiaceae bacterium]